MLKPKVVPTGVIFKTETLQRIGHKGDNWCITWTKDGSQIVSMDDGSWLNDGTSYHNRLYRLTGDSNDFIRRAVPGYPRFDWAGQGWFGYGVYSVNGTLYSLVSRTPSSEWDGPFRGIKLLKSTDNGHSWYRISPTGQARLLTPDDTAREDMHQDEMFFFEQAGMVRGDQTAYPFSFCSFVQNGQDNSATKDDFIYIYSPEGAYSHRLLLARVRRDQIEQKGAWEFFCGWDGNDPVWTQNLAHRQAVHDYPEKNAHNAYFGWYSWLPSVVWNKGLQLYIMANGGTYAGHGLSDAPHDYFDRWMHTKTGSLGLWYSENPYGPWTEFYYNEAWTVDDENNRTYQPKLSPKWISDDGKTMVLIWSDAMKNAQGRSHTTNYVWNQMEIEIQLTQYP